MLLYEYSCEEYRTMFEKLISNAESQVVCVQCQSKRVKKQFSAATAALRRPITEKKEA